MSPGILCYTEIPYTDPATSEPLIATGAADQEEARLLRQDKSLILGFLLGTFFQISSSAIFLFSNVLLRIWGDDLNPNSTQVVVVAASCVCTAIVSSLTGVASLILWLVLREETKTCTNGPCSGHMERGFARAGRLD
jgi:hypothetical protein